ncbi:FCD domain-containing protein [bacterium]|nr:FCD domain-containing protein [bacterium]
MTATVRKSRKAAATTGNATRRESTSAGRVGIDHGQRRKVIVEQLLTDIFQGRLHAGERLVITTLADRFGVSQSPIREALVSLEGVGIVDIEPNCGAVVRRVTEADVREVCQVRRALECAAVRLACGRTDLGELQQLADAFRSAAEVSFSASGRNSRTRSGKAGHGKPRSGDRRSVRKAIDSARELDSRLHDLIAESCGNRFLKKELGRLKLLFRSFRDVAWDQRSSDSDLARFAEEAREHLAIVEALLTGDRKAASRAMSCHIRSGVKYWSRGLPR